MVRILSRLVALTLLLAVAAVPFFAQGSSIGTVAAQDAATPCAALTQEDAVAWATAWAAAWNSHDPDQVVALSTPGAIHHWGIGVDSEGADEMSAAVANFFAAFPGVHVTVDRVWWAGDTVIIRWIAIGIQETDFMGIPASQTTVTWTGINIHQLECGLSSESWSEVDHFGRIQQQGMISLGTPEAEAVATPAG